MRRPAISRPSPCATETVSPGSAGGSDDGRRLRPARGLVSDDRQAVGCLVDLGARSDPRPLRARDAQPAGAVDDRLACAGAHRLTAHAPVVQPDAAIGVGQGRVVVADHQGGRALLVHQLADQGVHERGRCLVELARRLVGEQQPRPVRERRAQRDALLLAAREAPGQLVGAIRQADALEQRAGALVPLGRSDAAQRERQLDRLAAA